MRRCIILFLSALILAVMPAVAAAQLVTPFSLVEPQGADGLSFEDEAIRIVFAPSMDGLGITLKNKTTGPIRILWGFSYYKGPDGRHRALGHGPANKIQAAVALITPGETYKEMVYPIDQVSVQEIKPFLKEEISAGAGFDLVLELDFNGVKKRYTFGFNLKGNAFVEKDPWLAAGLSLLVPSTGHAYTGDWKRGLYYALPRFLAAIMGGDSQESSAPAREAYLVMGLAEAIDAFQQAQKVNKSLLVEKESIEESIEGK